MDQEVERWIQNAEKGIIGNKPNYVLTSSSRLKALGKTDDAIKILEEALSVFSDNLPIFRELSTMIIEKDPVKGIELAKNNVTKFGVHAKFQEAVALSKLGRNKEAITQIENVLKEAPELREDRFTISKLSSLYHDEGLWDDVIQLLEPLIDKAIFTDIAMKQHLAAAFIKKRTSMEKVIDLLKEQRDPQSNRLRRQAREILTGHLAEMPVYGDRGIIDLPTEHQYLRLFLVNFLKDYPDIKRNVFLIMRFKKEEPLQKIEEAIRTACAIRNLNVIRSDDKEYSDDLLNNVMTYIYGCSSGIAVFDQINYREFNPNIALEIGFMLSQCKKVLLLKDKAIPSMPTDVVGKIYKEFDTYHPMTTIPPLVDKWITDYRLGMSL
jgi:tetratricopeptide (TPR) repeat protein